MRTTQVYRAYVAVTFFALPFLKKRVLGKVTKHGFSQARAEEKLGRATVERPAGAVIWFHAASVGETMSVLALIERLGVQLPQATFLVTSGTPTSAEILQKRLPPRTRHQFAPLDAPGPVSRFLKHWKPNAAIFVESELWPQMILRSHAIGVPLALVNARMSDSSLRMWSRFPRTAKLILGTFRVTSTQTDSLAQALIGLGAPETRVSAGANLKALATPLPQNADVAAQIQEALGGRPTWIAASTHEGEEEVVLDTHETLLKTHPDLTLILAPRHPERAEAIAKLIKHHGWSALRRSQGALPNGPVYLADTVGELGTWYALSKIVFLGGSLRPIGGHNPFEPALAGTAVCSGPHVTNFQDTYDAMTAVGAAALVQDAASLTDCVATWLGNADARQSAQNAAVAFCDGQTGQLDDIASKLIHDLGLNDANAA